MRPADDLDKTLDADSTGYATPWHVDGPEQCLFYHSMDLPGLGTQIGAWDLRNCTDSYLGYQDVRGSRVVDVGAASGFLSFEMEKRGASVVAFDVSLDVQEFAADMIPLHDTVAVSGPSKEQVLARLLDVRRRTINSFWLCHRLLGSRVKACYGNVYDPPAAIDRVDVTLFGNVLQHLHDPLRALDAFARLTDDRIIVTETCQVDLDYESKRPVMWLRANAAESENTHTWWQLTPGLLQQYLRVLGFGRFELGFHFAKWTKTGSDVRQFTLVAAR